MNAYLELTKPRITWLILVSTGVGFYFGASESWSWLLLAHTLLGTALMASGTAALNQWYESDADAKMRRTEQRPIPSGRISREHAMWFGIALSIAGFLELWLGANLLTALLGCFTLITYLFVYTPLKQRSWHSTTVGAVPGAMPPLIGFAAAAGTLSFDAWALYAILFLWQFPHFYAIAWMYREDYGRAGIRMLPVVEPGGESTARQILIYSTLLIPISLIPRWLHMAGDLYFAAAVVLGLFFVWAGVKVAIERTNLRARGVLLASVVYLPLLLGMMVFDHRSF